jgi:ABC-type cobalamin/Fe3+-siderophores transport system ATPase subunit
VRIKKIEDYWRGVNTRKGFSLWIDKVLIKEIDGFDDLSIKLKSGVSVFCGRNGSGKTTLLKVIYRLISGKEGFSDSLFERLDTSHSEITVDFRDSEILKYTDGGVNSLKNIEYFDPTEITVLIVQKIISDSNIVDWVEGIDPSQVLNNRITDVRRVTGKRYDSVDVFEVPDILDDDQVLPYIMVKCGDVTYTNESMGLGEHKILVMLWKLFNLERSSILLIEEPEAFLCPKSQLDFMDVVASVSCQTHSNFLISSHSEHIVSKASIESSVIMLDRVTKGFSVVEAQHRSKSISALGLTSSKVGCLLVEDAFAAKVLKKILINSDSFLLHTHHIANQNGESNIVKLIQHYDKNGEYKFVGVFDADHRGKIVEDHYSWPICFLPGDEALAPEMLVINDFKSRVEVYAKKLNMDADLVIDALATEVDHHDFFLLIGEKLGFAQTVLEDFAIDLWLSSQTDNVEQFLFSIENFGSKVEGYVDVVAKLIKVTDKIYCPLHEENNTMDLDKLAGTALTGEIKYSSGKIVYHI